MYANCEINMPKRYVELSENEMEYDGGFFGINFVASIVATAVGLVVDYAGDKGLIDKDLANVISAGCTVVSVVCSLGTIGTVANANAALKLGKEFIQIGGKTVKTADAISNGLISLSADGLSYTVTGIAMAT